VHFINMRVVMHNLKLFLCGIARVLFIDTFRLITCIKSSISVTFKDIVHLLYKQAFTAKCSCFRVSRNICYMEPSGQYACRQQVSPYNLVTTVSLSVSIQYKDTTHLI
jgi:hypothetical protein